MYRTVFKINGMDCPTEEQLIRMKLMDLSSIKSLDFDLPNRSLSVIHSNASKQILERLNSLNLGTSEVSSTSIEKGDTQGQTQRNERRTLWTILIINFSFFAIELTTGLISRSMGLVADSLDMLADSIVYALALMAVGGTFALKRTVARFAGYFQILLASIGLTEVIRRFIGAESIPDFRTMIIVSAMALIANIVCLYLLQKSKSGEPHMRASMIFTSNDIIINAGVITAALLVNWLNSSYPDLIIGGIVFLIVARGAYRILKL